MKLTACILLWSLCAINLCWGQAVSINIKDNKKNPLPGVSVKLTKVEDSVAMLGATDNKGIARFENIQNGLYVVKLSYIGFETLEKSITIKSEARTFSFQLKEGAITLGEVSVAAQKPLIRQEDDKMIVDPLPLINTSTNTLEVLEKTPGIYVDQDGGVYLTGTSPATIFINGREQKMSNQDIASLLRNLPPGSVDKIEVLRTPSTKYDASSSGGIINIVLKKGVKIGQFGTVNAGINQGFYGNQFAGFNYNYSGLKTTAYINLNYTHRERMEQLNNFRLLASDTLLSQSGRSRYNTHNAYLGYGGSYDINEKTSFSYDGRINGGVPYSCTNNSNVINTSSELLLAENDNKIDNHSKNLNIQQDFGLLWKLDTSGSNLDTKLTYSFNNNSNVQDYISNYTLPVYAEILGKGDNLQQRHFIIFQSDLTWQFPYKIKMEAGIKSSYQNYDSDADYLINTGGTYEQDSRRTNAFLYQENINAAYIQASKTFGKYLTVKTGVRMEHTFMKGRQSIPSDTSFLINRVDWFPYIYISRRIVKVLGIELKGYLIYRRTISRPDYQNLNPYVKYVDEFLYETGNPSLKPQFTDNYEVNISFQEFPVLAFGQNFTKDIFSGVVYQDENQQAISVRTFDNLGKSTETYFRLMVGIPPGKKYFFALGAQYNYNKYNGIYDNQQIDYSRDSWRLFTFHSLTLFKYTKITLSGFMMVHGQMNFYELKNFGQLNIGISQSFLNGKLTLSLSARDVLKTVKTKFELNQGSIHIYGDRYTDSQRFGINIRYNFGIKKKEVRKGFMQFEEEE